MLRPGRDRPMVEMAGAPERDQNNCPTWHRPVVVEGSVLRTQITFPWEEDLRGNNSKCQACSRPGGTPEYIQWRSEVGGFVGEGLVQPLRRAGTTGASLQREVRGAGTGG